jgi:release factor glutamine methyltransferase
MFVATNTVEAIINYYTEKLSVLYEKSEVKRITELVFEHFLDWTPLKLSLSKTERLSESELLKFHFALKRLTQGEPLQYVIGHTYFYGLKIEVNSSVLIPRQETEELVEWIIEESTPSNRILDLGTGSGCIALAIKSKLPESDVVGVDISTEALKIAQLNSKTYKLEVDFIQADVLAQDIISSVGVGWDVIVSNPPYIPYSEKDSMHTNVTQYEPHLALFVHEENPLVFYHRIAELAKSILTDEGKLYFEISNRKGEDVVRLLEEKGFKNVTIKKDLQGNDRMVCAYK